MYFYRSNKQQLNHLTKGLTKSTNEATDLDYSRTVGADKSRDALFEETALHLDHVLLGNTLGDGDDEGNPRVDGLHDGRCGPRRWYIYHCSVTLRSVPSLQKCSHQLDY